MNNRTDSTNPYPQKLSFARIAAATPSRNPTFLQISSNGQQDASKSLAAQKYGEHIPAYNSSSVLSQEILRQQVPAQAEARAGIQVQQQSHSRAADHRGSIGMLQAQQSAARPPDRTMLEDGHSSAPSSTDLMKPPSLDGKSIASGTTFALDEKESLRPDDSASVMAAAEEEDAYLPPSTNMSSSRPSSDEGMQAFQQQLHEISALDPQIRGPSAPALASRPISQPQGSLYIPPSGPGIGLVPGRGFDGQVGPFDLQPDPKLLEALESPRDRIWVLKLEQDIFDFVKDPKEVSLNLPQCNAYHRMLAHKMADYSMLGHLVDESGSVRLYKTPNCRIPPSLTAITTPSTAASTPPPGPPQMKILRRRDNDASGGSNGPSKNASETEESGTEDDRKKAPASREEREARYEAARLRIMGSAKPSDMPEATKEPEESRSSSAAGKKNRKKQRTDSEDGFEARSAYSAYYPSPYSPNGYAPSSYGNAQYAENTMSGHTAYAAQASQGMLQHGHHMAANSNWSHVGYPQSVEQQQYWNASSAPPYDLSNDFQRAMSLQGEPSAVNSRAHPGCNSSPASPHYPLPSGTWAQQHPQTQQRGPLSGYGYGQQYAERSQISPHQSHEHQPYQFGQLPSQTFPGRQPSKLEHPLPGSYKGKHFNPQSQTFVPAQPMTLSPFRPYPPQPPMTQQASSSYVNQQSLPNSRQRAPPAAHQHGANFNHNTLSPVVPTVASSGSQPLVHPLPQPVFPLQASPQAPLPAKPSPTANRNNEMGVAASPGSGNSSIAKWGAPASLPAKPPPSNFDKTQRGPIPLGAKSAEVQPVNVYPAVVNGSGTPTKR